MPIDDPHTWAQGAAALKSAFDAIRGLLGAVKDVRGLANPEQAMSFAGVSSRRQ
jgi:hypothetical protein